jgi:hypothetical protein
MNSVCSSLDLETNFGTLHDQVIEIITKTYPFVRIEDGLVYFRFSLDMFKETFELFSVDPSMVSEMIVVNDLFQDETIDPEMTILIFDWLQPFVEYEPISPLGELTFSFQDIRKWYGESFDDEMKKKYEQYEQVKEYLME